MSDATDHPDALAALYLKNRDVPCPGCGYNRRNATSARCPECGYTLTLWPEFSGYISARPLALSAIAYSLLACALVSAIYAVVYMFQFLGFPYNPFSTLLEFAFTLFAITTVAAVMLCATHILKYRAARSSRRRPTALLVAATLLFHAGWALFLILALISSF